MAVREGGKWDGPRWQVCQVGWAAKKKKRGKGAGPREMEKKKSWAGLVKEKEREKRKCFFTKQKYNLKQNHSELK
jgi:hypothetical protein